MRQQARAKTIIGAIAAVFALSAAIYIGVLKTAKHPALPSQRSPLAQGRVQGSAAAPESVSTTPSKAMNPSIIYSKMFANSHDYWALAHALLPRAKAGNADAEFYLFDALERCSKDNKMYFQRRGENLTIDQGLQWAFQRHLSIEVAQAVYDRCHEFQEHDLADLGSANDWLERATTAGQPLAQVNTALKLLAQEALRNAQRAGAVSNPDAPPTIDSQQDSRELLRKAVESKDPEVLFSIGAAQDYLNPGGADNTVNQFAWWLVACERGLDCTANAEWVKVACSNDARCSSFTDSSELVRTLSGNDWNNVRQRAQEISAKLDASQWANLGLSL